MSITFMTILQNNIISTSSLTCQKYSTGQTLGNMERKYLKDKGSKVETVRKSIRDLCKGMIEFRKGYQYR